MRFAILSLIVLTNLLALEPVVQRNQPAVLYALGDVHGDYERMVRLLYTAGIIDADNHWAARDAILVVTGDMIDKGPRPVDVIRLLAALRKSAPQAGGEVILLAGNHEAEFLAGPDPKKAADFLEDLKRGGIKSEDVVACRGDIGETLCSLPFAARVGDWFFSHAGNTAGRSIPKLATDVSAGFTAHRYKTLELTGPDSILEARLGEGKEWIAVHGRTERELLSSYANALGVKHIVQGHQHNAIRFDDNVTRMPGEMFQHWGLLFLIDVGMSRGIDDSAGALLEIRNDTATAICAAGTRTLLWSEQTKQDAGRAPACAQ